MSGYPRPYGIEDGIRYSYYEDLKTRYQELGYKSAKEAIIDLYEHLGGITPVGEVLGLSKSNIALKLKKFGHPMKGKGGANNPFGRKGKPCEK